MARLLDHILIYKGSKTWGKLASANAHVKVPRESCSAGLDGKIQREPATSFSPTNTETHVEYVARRPCTQVRHRKISKYDVRRPGQVGETEKASGSSTHAFYRYETEPAPAVIGTVAGRSLLLTMPDRRADRRPAAARPQSAEGLMGQVMGKSFRKNCTGFCHGIDDFAFLRSKIGPCLAEADCGQNIKAGES